MRLIYGGRFRVRFALGAWAIISTSFASAQATMDQKAACEELRNIANLTVLSAQVVTVEDGGLEYCYLRGLINPAIHYHVQLPLPDRWNGRFLMWGDGGKDGDLDFADHRVAEGYAVANSNTGHDSASEPGASFGFNNRQAEIDFGYRAVHVTATAARSVIRDYYGRAPEYSYMEGCSTGGRQGLMEAQRFPYDFDGIVAGAPVLHYQATNISHAFMLQKTFEDNFAGNLAFDTDGNGVPDSLTKANLLSQVVLDKCDALDGIRDGVIDDPLACDFEPAVDLEKHICTGDRNADNCFTRRQVRTIRDFYSGPYDSRGVNIMKGKSLGSEWAWPNSNIPHVGNNLRPVNLGYVGDHLNFLFYEEDPGLPPPDVTDLSYKPHRGGELPEFVWWEFNYDDVTSGKGDLMASITDALDPDLGRYLTVNGGKLILYHGWSDFSPAPEPTLDYYREMVDETFEGNMEEARRHARIFMVPGMGHCGGGPGPNEWDKLPALVDWVERGRAPDHVVVTHETDGRVDNERKVCAYPQKAVYSGPAGGRQDPANWREENFTCR